MTEHHKRCDECEAREHERGGDIVLAELVQQISELNRTMTQHIEQDSQFKASVRSAFPAGDFSGHCRAHEAEIKAAEAEEKFWADTKVEVARKGLVGAMGLVLGLMLLGLIAWGKSIFGGH